MRKLIAVILFLLLCPTISLGDRYGGYRHGPRPDYYQRNYHHDDSWIVPLAIFGGVLGVMALSQMSTPPPMPPQRICRDTYDYYDDYGQFLYSRYVDRPCRN